MSDEDGPRGRREEIEKEARKLAEMALAAAPVPFRFYGLNLLYFEPEDGHPAWWSLEVNFVLPEDQAEGVGIHGMTRFNDRLGPLAEQLGLTGWECDGDGFGDTDEGEMFGAHFTIQEPEMSP